MRIAWATGFFDFPAARFEAGVRFWLSVTGATLSPPRGSSGEFVTLLPEIGDAYLRVQRVEQGPGGIHLDLHAVDVEESSQAALDLGAAVFEVGPGRTALVSPAGVRFCLVGHRGERHRPPPTVSAAGVRSLVDQVSVDVGPTRYAEEAAFWTGLTGWERHRGALPEFEYLVRPADVPLRLLLQRLADDDPSGGRVHVDLACDDVARETRRHVALGASVIRVMRYWTTLTDPTGLAYCITARNPDTGLL